MSATDPVAEARELLAAATPGPWSLHPYADGAYDNPYAACDSIIAGEAPVLRQLGCGCCDIGLEGRVADAKLIAAAPRLLAELADEVERLRPSAIRACECPNDDDPSGCYCPDGFSHDDCPMDH